MLIDLDRFPPPPAPSVRRGRRKPWWLLPVLLLLLTGGAQAPSGVPTIRPWVVTGDRAVNWLVGDGTLYSVHTVAGEDTVLVEARGIPGSEPRWTRRLDGEGFVPRLLMVGRDPAVDFDGLWTVVLDHATGAQRWSSAAYPDVFVAGDRFLIVDDEGRVGLADPATGRAAWWRPMPGWPLAATAVGRYVQVIYNDGTGVLHDRDTGRPEVVVTGLPRRGEAEPGGRDADAGAEPPAMTVSGDLAVVFGDDRATALRLPRLDRLWTARVPGVSAVSRCGDRVCMTGFDGLTVLDQETGAPLWHSTDWISWNGRLAASDSGHIARLDPDTGTVLAAPRPGRLAGDFLLSAGTDRTGIFEQSTGRLRAVVPGTLPWCLTTGDDLACQTESGAVAVWHIPI